MVAIIEGQVIEVYEDRDKEQKPVIMANFYQSRTDNPDLKKPQTVAVKFPQGFEPLPVEGERQSVKVSITAWGLNGKSGLTCMAIH